MDVTDSFWTPGLFFNIQLVFLRKGSEPTQLMRLSVV